MVEANEVYGENGVLEWLPEKQAGQLFLIGGVLPMNELHHTCSLATRIQEYTTSVLLENGFQRVGFTQLVPADDNNELLTIRLVVHYIGRELAVQRPVILPEELADGMVHEDLDPRVLKALGYTQALLEAQL